MLLLRAPAGDARHIFGQFRPSPVSELFQGSGRPVSGARQTLGGIGRRQILDHDHHVQAVLGSHVRHCSGADVFDMSSARVDTGRRRLGTAIAQRRRTRLSAPDRQVVQVVDSYEAMKGRLKLMVDLPAGMEGVLPNHHIEKAIASEVISGVGGDIPIGNIQPASLDLRLGEVAHRIQCSFLPGPNRVADRLQELSEYQVDLTDDEGAVLEVGLPYVIPLMEKLRLPQRMRGRANPKSSTGRADVFTRVITDFGARFDDIRPGYAGQLYLEVVPLSFPIRVYQGLTLNQLRLSVGNTALSDAEIRAEHADGPLLSANGKALQPKELQLSSGLFLGLNLRGPKAQGVGWRARGSAPLLNMGRTRSSDPAAFWDKVQREPGDRIVLQPKSFYLLMSYEAVTIPPHLAAEMAAYDPTSGELRTHYAGFFDPGFGYTPGPRQVGSTAALEVRAHDVAFMIEHRQHVCKLTFERMLEPPTMLYGDNAFGSNYQGQTETLGKHFKVEGETGVTPTPPGVADDPQQLELGGEE